MKNINKILMASVYPEKCPICEKIITEKDKLFCLDCETRLTKISEPVCAICGRPVIHEKTLCTDCENYNHIFDGGRITFSYEQVSDSLYRFKYMNRPEYARAFGREIALCQKGWLEAVSPELIIPVPLHKKRLIKRGYNQAEELANAISEYAKIPVNTTLVRRVKNTAPLKYSGRSERQNYMKNTFIVCENVVKLSTVVLIDDIFTTGSTLDSLAGELKAHGVKNIYFLTITAAGT